MQRTLASASAALLLAAPSVLANDGGVTTSTTVTSSASCTATAVSGSEAWSESAFVEFGKDIGLYVCDEDADIKIEAVKSAVAQAYAYALAYTSVDCTVTGSGTAEARAVASAESTATAYAEALLDGFVSIETCAGCTAAVGFFATATKEELLKATARSESQIKVVAEADGRERRDAQHELVEDLKESVLVAVAGIVGTASARHDSCGVAVTGCAAVFTDDAKEDEFGCCEVDVSAKATDYSPDVVAQAIAVADAKEAVCADTREVAVATSFAIAEKVLTAYAEAVSKADVFCYATSEASICAWGEAGITAYAEAQGEAVANAIASVDNACGCTFDADAMAVAVGAVFADATSSALAEACAESGGEARAEAIAKDVAESSIDLVAIALAQAFASGYECGIYASADAQVDTFFAYCDIDGFATQAQLTENALVDLTADAQAFLCDADSGEADASAELTATALASAWAAVTADWAAECVSSGDAGACGWVGADVREVAVAFADSFADAWAAVDEYGTCGCAVEAEAAAETIADLVVIATVKVADDFCVAGGETFSKEEFKSQMVEGTLTAFGEAIAKVKVETIDGNPECTATAEVTTDAIPGEVKVAGCDGKTCAKTGRKCASRERWPRSVIGCCSADDACVQVSKRKATCQPKADLAEDAVVRTCA